ncbi:outer membrane beta-barrel protein [Shewanella violacea]|uniref:OmpA family protein n=1 Tax=Shewanella violacea (strain JCM 10179 / CIP 106290 / LMG 19151 / DSS12) TaxID=637905 RepID=D4ZCW6_SHEVD|nr:outer membrane beta-barrel protein [Shewanella violacea]BAJ03861.1 OmpA family protein [Shewanella violacea DSS12]
MKKTLLAIALMSTFSYANAADVDNTWYVGAGLGQANYEAVNVTGDYLSDDSDLAWNALVGYQLNKYFAVEAGWQDLGTLDDAHMRTDNGQNIEVDGFTLGLVGTLPLNEKWFLTGEAGAYQYHIAHQMTADHYVSATDTAAYFGAGVGYNITDSLAISAKYRRFAGIDETEWNTADMDAQTVGVQMTYRFGIKPAVVVAAVVAPVIAPEPVYETKVEQKSTAVLFGFDSSELSTTAQAKLDEVVRVSKLNDNDTILLIGQADSRGDAGYNQKLSEARAQHVEDYLVSHGVEVQQLGHQASGEQDSHASSSQDRAQERRVIITLTSETQVEVIAS